MSSAADLLEDVREQLVERFAGDEAPDDVAAARAEFERRRGRVFEDEELWESEVRTFLEWYVFERTLSGQDVPHSVHAIAGESDSERRSAMRSWLRSYRSLFELTTATPHQLRLLDLLGGAECLVFGDSTLLGLDVGDVFEARLVGHGDDLYFGQGFVFHPAGTGEAIVGHARRIVAAQGSATDVLDHCASLRVKCERYRHVSPTRVYGNV